MKPLKLELQAFGPYVERQTVDFEKLAQSGIFLIKGNTGSDAGEDTDPLLFQQLQADAARDAEGRREPAGEMASAARILKALILDRGRIIRVPRPRRRLQGIVVRGSRVFVADHHRERRAAGVSVL